MRHEHKVRRGVEALRRHRVRVPPLKQEFAVFGAMGYPEVFAQRTLEDAHRIQHRYGGTVKVRFVSDWRAVGS